MKFINSKITFKIVINIVIVVSTATFFLLFYFYNSDTKKLENNLNRRTNLISDFIEIALVEHIWDWNIENIARVSKKILNTKQLEAINIYDNNKTLILSFKKSNGDIIKLINPYKIKKETNLIYKVNSKILKKTETIGFYELFITKKYVFEERRNSLIRISILFILFTILIIVTIYPTIKKIVISPIITLSNFTNEVAKTKIFSKRIDRQGNDEISSLYTGFNKMLIEIQNKELKEIEYLDKLKVEHDNLEIKVEARTKEIKKAKEQAESANHAKSEFLANMSHEIRTPMNAILGFTEILSEKETDNKKKKYLSTILSSGKALLSLINDILDLSKVEAGKMELQYSNVSIQHLFSELETVFSNKIMDKGVKFNINISKNFPKNILIDETRIRQILINLIGNAIKFTETGHITMSANSTMDSPLPPYSAQNKHGNGTIKISTGDKTKIIIFVEDTGSGIPENQLNNIFGAFNQIKDQKYSKFGGTGLGLAITKQLVNMMNGEIIVESKVEEGSKFSIIFNEIELISDNNIKKNQDKNILNTGSIMFESATLLIADDIEINRQLLKGILDNYNFKFIECKNGKEAIEKTEEYLPDVILMDVKMPVMGGYEASIFLKNSKKLKHIPIIIITASAMKEEEIKIRKISDSYLTKPVSIISLISELSKYLPYTEKISSQTDLSEKDENFYLDDLSSFPELFKEIKNRQKTIKELQINMAINEINKFSDEIKELGEKHNSTNLINWSEKLNSAVSMFEIDKMKTLLKKLEITGRDDS